MSCFLLADSILGLKMLSVIVQRKFLPGMNCPENNPWGAGIFPWRWSQIFGFQKGLGGVNVLSALCLVLVDADVNRELLVLAGLGVSQAFDSLVHESIIYAARKRGV
jgi:hypothetical protein